jgi:hypothetical protein
MTRIDLIITVALQLGTRIIIKKETNYKLKKKTTVCRNTLLVNLQAALQMAGGGRTTLLVVAAPAASAARGASPSAVEVAWVDRVGRPVPAGLVGGGCVVRPPVVAAAPVLGASSSGSAEAAGAAAAAGAVRPAGAVLPAPLPVGAAGLLPGRVLPDDVQKSQTDSGVGHLFAVDRVGVPEKNQ